MMHRLENNVEHREQHNQVCHINQIACNLGTKYCLVCQDVSSRVYSVAGHDEIGREKEFAENHDRHCEQDSKSSDSGSLLLRFIDIVNYHFFCQCKKNRSTYKMVAALACSCHRCSSTPKTRSQRICAAAPRSASAAL